jgi:hypothetical protein
VIGARREHQQAFRSAASQRPGSPSTSKLRISSAPGEPPGSRVTTHFDAARIQRCRQSLRLRGFAGALAAFQRDEAAGHCAALRPEISARSPRKDAAEKAGAGNGIRGIDGNFNSGKSGAVI